MARLKWNARSAQNPILVLPLGLITILISSQKKLWPHRVLNAFIIFPWKVSLFLHLWMRKTFSHLAQQFLAWAAEHSVLTWQVPPSTIPGGTSLIFIKVSGPLKEAVTINTPWLHTSISPEWNLSLHKTDYWLRKCSFKTMTLDLSYTDILESLLVRPSLFCQPLEPSWWLFLVQVPDWVPAVCVGCPPNSPPTYRTEVPGFPWAQWPAEPFLTVTHVLPLSLFSHFFFLTWVSGDSLF